ncbi:putative glycosyltransferase family 4 protein [Phaeomoniella chlamydospora]|uniref:Putative glycosyltransferase family 4 protein n=1 Tax=Phaeomoniella chlamydospora TaxID=158046 RepID=A0A0G2E715_PHACM|nr:putative glycosyltransferase family 4 protein [Phaeomoniella chlamydospora]
MRVAIVAPLCECVPPKTYGGTERVIHWMAEELVRLGHTVTLYACGGSETSADLIECYPASFRELKIPHTAENYKLPYYKQLDLAINGPIHHDIIHIHHGTFHWHPAVMQRLTKACKTPILWTDHGSVHNDGKPEILQALTAMDIPMTSISDSQRNSLPQLEWLAAVQHGLPVNLLSPTESLTSDKMDGSSTYIAFLGRIAPEKGVPAAVRIAEKAGYPLKVAAKICTTASRYYEEQIKPLFREYNVNFIGEINEKQKAPFLSNALALIFPICWMEPFGLVMIEAMACGCPVVAFRNGSVPEVISDGVTGFVVDTEDEAVEVLKKVGTLDRKRVREVFESKWTSAVMSKKYVDVYEKVCEEHRATLKANAIRTLQLESEAFNVGGSESSDEETKSPDSSWSRYQLGDSSIEGSPSLTVSSESTSLEQSSLMDFAKSTPISTLEPRTFI